MVYERYITKPSNKMPTLQLSDYGEFFIDFAIKDRSGDIVRVVEVKTGTASLSKGQKALFKTTSEVAGNNKEVTKGKDLTDVPKTVIRVTFTGQ